MSLIRHGQRILTRLSPHDGNARYIKGQLFVSSAIDVEIGPLLLPIDEQYTQNLDGLAIGERPFKYAVQSGPAPAICTYSIPAGGTALYIEPHSTEVAPYAINILCTDAKGGQVVGRVLVNGVAP